MSAELWMLRPTGLTTQTVVFEITFWGSGVTAIRPADAAPGFDEGLITQAAPSTSPRAPHSVNRIIGVTLPLEGKSTLGRHPSRWSRHPHAVPHPEGAAPAGREADDRPASRRLRRRWRGGRDRSDLAPPRGGGEPCRGPLRRGLPARAAGHRPRGGPGAGGAAGRPRRAGAERRPAAGPARDDRQAAGRPPGGQGTGDARERSRPEPAGRPRPAGIGRLVRADRRVPRRH